MTLCLIVVLYKKIIVRYKKNAQALEFLNFPPSGMSVHFIPYNKNKISIVSKKIRTVGNPNTYG
jgi:hypothetical protein